MSEDKAIVKGPIRELLEQRHRADKLWTAKSVYCDGGLLGSQEKDWGCRLGGTWAWVAVTDPQTRDLLIEEDCHDPQRVVELGGIDAFSEVVDHESGVVLSPETRGVTNNHTEQIAIVRAIEALPHGWTGTIYTDSRTALLRVQSDYQIYNLRYDRKATSEKGLPKNISSRSKAAVRRLGRVVFVLLQGHPDSDELQSGWGRKRDLPVSKWNVWCDDECNRQKEEYFKKLVQVQE